MKYTKMNRVAFEEKIRAGEYMSVLGAYRAIGKARELTAKERVELKEFARENIVSGSASFKKIARRLNRGEYSSLSYALSGIDLAAGLSKAERRMLNDRAVRAFQDPAPAEATPVDTTVKKSLSKVFFKKRPFFEVFNETMQNKKTRELITEFCCSALEAEGDGVSLPSIVEAIKRVKAG